MNLSFIEINPDVMTGKPVIKGTRITVECIMDMIANGDSVNDVLEAFPHLSKEQVLAALKYATEVFKEDAQLPK